MTEYTPVDAKTLLVNATALAEFLVDLPPDTLRSLYSEQPGYDEVQSELVDNQASMGERAGIPDSDIQKVTAASERIARIDSLLPIARKLVEILTESRAYHDDIRQRLVFAIAAGVVDRAKRFNDADLLARYQKTCAYRSYIGRKAAQTRRRNQAQASKAQPPKNVAAPVAPQLPGDAQGPQK